MCRCLYLNIYAAVTAKREVGITKTVKILRIQICGYQKLKNGI